MHSLSTTDFDDIADLAAGAITAATPGLAATLTLFPGNDEGEGLHGCQIVLHPARTAVRGELLRIDDSRYHGPTSRRAFIDVLIRRLAPLLKGVRYRGVPNEASDGVIVLPPELRDDNLSGHEGSPKPAFSTANSARA